MKHYDLQEVLEWVGTGDCAHLDATPKEIADYFAALVTQANAAHEAQKRCEQAEDEALFLRLQLEVSRGVARKLAGVDE